MKKLFCGVLLCLSTSAWAGFDEGLAAYEKQDYATALKEWGPLEEQGNPEAQYRLGRMYVIGGGVKVSCSEAMKWFQKAAEQGHARAQYRLGRLYTHDIYGGCQSQNFQEAFKWLRKAAEQGVEDALNYLGVLYSNGQGVPVDKKEAVKWWRKAVEKGSDSGMENLGWYTSNGWGTEKNLDEGERLLKLAVSHGMKSAERKLELIPCLRKSSTVLFGETLNCTSQWDLRNALQEGGLKAERENGRYWYDLYESSAVLEGTSQLAVAYINQKFARAYYTFPASMDEGKVVKVRDMVVSKYGKPFSSSGNPSLGEVKYIWKLKDGITVEVSRGWPDTTVYLAYEHPQNFAAMNAEQERQNQAQEAEKHSKQNKAF